MSFDDFAIKASIIPAGENNTDHITATPQFFSAVMRKRAINNILEDDDE